jgi:hypothetical protein
VPGLDLTALDDIALRPVGENDGLFTVEVAFRGAPGMPARTAPDAAATPRSPAATAFTPSLALEALQAAADALRTPCGT